MIFKTYQNYIIKFYLSMLFQVALVFFGLSSDAQAIFQGLILVIAVTIDGYRARKITLWQIMLLIQIIIKMVKKKIVQKEPYEINIEKGKKYAWCSCGLSNKQPFCDGSHSLTKYKPIIVVAKNNKTVFFLWL